MKEQEFFEKMAAVWLELSTLKATMETIAQDMAQLESAGMTSAKIHIRADNGGMELLHHSGSEYEQKNGRRREYVGKKPEAQEAARARIQRFGMHRKLKDELAIKNHAIRLIEHEIDNLCMAALGKQAELFSGMGTPGSAISPPAVPTDLNRLTPKDVVEYFKRSPNLREIAGYVEETLGKDEWGGSEKLAA